MIINEHALYTSLFDIEPHTQETPNSMNSPGEWGKLKQCGRE